MRFEFTYTIADFDEWAKAPKPHAKGKWRSQLTGWLVFVALAILLVKMVQRSPRPTTAPTIEPESSFLNDIFLPMAPWLAIFICIWVFVFKQLRGQGKRLWNNNEDLRQLHIIAIDPGGIEVTGPKMATRFLWAAFGGWFETRNLFILWQPNGQYTLIPKRAMSEPQGSELREILRQHVAAPVFGFPVLQQTTPGLDPQSPTRRP